MGSFMVRRRKPTQVDIARAAGVSPAVVSLVINGRADGKIRISSQTQQRVWDAVRSLDYVPNLAARQLAGGRNYLLGVFTFDSAFPVEHSNFYYPFLVGIEQKAEELRYDLMLFTRSSSKNGKRSIYRDGTNALQVADGSVLLGGSDDKAEVARLRNDGYPFVYVGRRELDGEQLTYVGADYISATVDVVRYVVQQGHSELRYLGPTTRNESSEDRELGFRKACVELGLDDPDRFIFRTNTVTADHLEAAIAQGATTFITESLGHAFDIIEFGEQRGLTVPDDFSIAVLGNTGDSTQDQPWITNFLIPRREMGSGAVQLLHEILTDAGTPSPRQQFLPCQFQQGTTVGPVKADR
jgi:DNA-binding LacI/PurR family transcriptional regulator